MVLCYAAGKMLQLLWLLKPLMYEGCINRFVERRQPVADVDIYTLPVFPALLRIQITSCHAGHRQKRLLAAPPEDGGSQHPLASFSSGVPSRHWPQLLLVSPVRGHGLPSFLCMFGYLHHLCTQAQAVKCTSVHLLPTLV